MNSSTWLVVRKDMRRFWPLLALWCAALVLHAGMHAWLGMERMTSGGGEVIFAIILVMLLNIYLVCQVIAEDSPVKEAAFWRMRPISGGRMLRAKLVFLGFWTLTLPAAVAAVASACYGFTLGEAAAITGGQLLLHAWLGLGFGMMAVLTRRVLVSFLGLFFLALVLQLWMGLRMNREAGIENAAYASESLYWSRVLVIAVIVVMACGAAAVWMYARRNRWAAWGSLAFGAAAVWMTGAFWKWDMLGGVPALKRLEASADGRLQATVLHTNLDSSEIRNGVSYSYLRATLRWSGLAAGEQCLTYLAEGRLTGANGLVIAQAHESWPSGAAFDPIIPLREIGIGRVISSWSMEKRDEDVALMRVPSDTLNKSRGQELNWSGQVSARVGRLEIEARVPLRTGAVFRNGANQFEVRDVDASQTELKVTFLERKLHVPTLGTRPNDDRIVSGVMPLMYALINVKRGEALFANGGGMSSGTSDDYFSYALERLEFDPAGARGGGRMTLDKKELAEWLRGAELVSFRFVEERRVKEEVSAVWHP